VKLSGEQVGAQRIPFGYRPARDGYPAYDRRRLWGGKHCVVRIRESLPLLIATYVVLQSDDRAAFEVAPEGEAVFGVAQVTITDGYEVLREAAALPFITWGTKARPFSQTATTTRSWAWVGAAGRYRWSATAAAASSRG